MSKGTVSITLKRLADYVAKTQLRRFSIGLHGGEPLLFSKPRMAELLSQIDAMSKMLNCEISTCVQTNGVLLDAEWLDMFEKFRTYVTLSIDGPPGINDLGRIDRLGRGTHGRIVNSIKMLRERGQQFSLLAVYNAAITADLLCSHLVDELGASAIDVLFPDTGIHDQKQLQHFFSRLFELWWTNYARRGVDIRICHGIFHAVLGRSPIMEGLGRARMGGVVIDYDGTYMLGDTISSLGLEFDTRQQNVRDFSVLDFIASSQWKEIFEESGRIPDECAGCQVLSACGGGFLPHRWVHKGGFNRRSRYCDALKGIYSEAAQKVLASSVNA